MAIRHRPNRPAPWQVYWNNPFTGKRESASYATEAEAKKEESLVKHRLKFERDSFKREESTSKTDNTAELTIEQLYLLYLKAKNFSREAISRQLGNLKWIFERIGATPVSQITKHLLKNLMAEMSALNVKATTVRDRFALLKTVLRWGAAQDYYAPVEIPPLPKPNYESFVPPTPQELQKMLDVAEPHIQRVIIIGSQFGARVGPCELFQLTWEDVDIRQRLLRVHGSKKNKNAPWREVPIRESLIPVFEKWREEDSITGAEHLINFNGNPVRYVKTAWKATLRRAGINRRIRPYDLRHAFATEAIAAGVDVGTVARLMGHSSPNMILQHYQFVMDKQKRAAVEALPEVKYVPKNMCPKN